MILDAREILLSKSYKTYKKPMSIQIISTSVPEPVAKAIRDMARKEDRSVSYIAGRILRRGLDASPVPQASFARRGRNNSKPGAEK